MKKCRICNTISHGSGDRCSVCGTIGYSLWDEYSSFWKGKPLISVKGFKAIRYEEVLWGGETYMDPSGMDIKFVGSRPEGLHFKAALPGWGNCERPEFYECTFQEGKFYKVAERRRCPNCERVDQFRTTWGRCRYCGQYLYFLSEVSPLYSMRNGRKKFVFPRAPGSPPCIVYTNGYFRDVFNGPLMRFEELELESVSFQQQGDSFVAKVAPFKYDCWGPYYRCRAEYGKVEMLWGAIKKRDEDFLRRIFQLT